MRIALCHPTYWPEVRRGSERVVHDAAEGLARRGHEVTVLTSHRSPTQVSSEDGFEVVRAWRPPGFPPLRWYESFVNTVPGLVPRLLRGRFDVVQAFHVADAYGAAQARRAGGPPFVFSFHGTPARTYLVARRYRLEMIGRAIEAAAETTVLSAFVASVFRRYLLVEPTVLPPGVHLDAFGSSAPRAAEPTLLCAADLSDPRKRGAILIEACDRLRRSRPNLRLELASRSGDGDTGFPGWVRGVPCEDTASLAAALGRSWGSVLPSVEEAFGLVVVESLAAGRPVAAARSGALPELVVDGTGCLFPPDDPAAAAAALDQVLAMSDEEGVEDRCRRQASRFDWAHLIDRYEDVLEKAAATR